MSKYSTLVKRVSNATAATALTLASLTPAVMLGGTAKAGQMTERKIAMSNSNVGTASTYTVSFKPSVNNTIKGIVIDFCEGSPIIGSNCADAMDSMVTPADSSTVTVNGSSWTVDGVSTQNGLVVLTNSTGITSITPGSTTVSFDLSVTNEGGTAGSFYARVLTYGSEINAQNYVDDSVGSYLDAGGIALSTTNDVTINARVQEQLTFCVGATADASALTGCLDGDWSGSTIDLGVLDSTNTATTPVPVAGTDGNNREGAFLVTTNAFYGAKVSYTSPTSLAVSGTTCENANTDSTDQCINADTIAAAFAAGGTEKFGMSLTNFIDNETPTGEGSWTYADTDGVTAGTQGYNSGYAWHTSAQTELVNSSSVVVNDVYEMTFKANAAATTPSGFYSTSANFVATATF